MKTTTNIENNFSYYSFSKFEADKTPAYKCITPHRFTIYTTTHEQLSHVQLINMIGRSRNIYYSNVARITLETI